jgi:cobalt-zinc-cadmium efflux system membrane fusion protein
MFGIAAILIVGVILVGRVWRSSEATPAAGENAATEGAEGGSGNVVKISDEARETIGLTVVVAEERPFAAMIQTTGVVTPDETRVAHIRPLAPGRVEQVHVRTGDRVSAGQALVTYDNIEMGQLTGEYRAAAAVVERAQAEAEVARRALERASRLVDSGGLSRAEYERRDAEHKRALAAISTERAAMANVEQKLRRFGVESADLAKITIGEGGGASRGVLRAPFAGVVIAASVAPGESVDTERELLTVADLANVWVLGDLYQKDLGAIRRGQEALITVESYPGQTFSGRISYISDVLDAASRTAKVRAEVPNRDGRLKLQMFVNMQLPTGDTRATVVIPSTAIQEIDEEQVVFVQTSDDTFEKRVVKVGAAQRDNVPVMEGIKAGERVVTVGAFMLKSKLKASSIEAEGEEKEEKK